MNFGIYGAKFEGAGRRLRVWGEPTSPAAVHSIRDVCRLKQPTALKPSFSVTGPCERFVYFPVPIDRNSVKSTTNLVEHCRACAVVSGKCTVMSTARSPSPADKAARRSAAVGSTHYSVRGRTDRATTVARRNFNTFSRASFIPAWSCCC